MNQPAEIIQLDEVFSDSKKEQKNFLDTHFVRNIVDTGLILIPLLMLSFSVLMLYSTTASLAMEKYSDELFFVKRQVFAGVLGIIGLIFGSFLSVRFLYKFSRFTFLLALLLLVLVFIPGIAKKAGGATRWVYILGFGFQPAEFVKLFYIIFIAGYFGRHELKMRTFFSGIFKPFFCVGILAFLLLMQPDFGTSAVLAGVTICLVIVMGAKFSHIASCAGFLVLAMSALVYTSPYRMKRLVAFIDPLKDESGSGYQLIQSLIAVASGKFTGMGLGSSQQKLYYLPAAHTDFIYAIIAEELGFIGAFLILLSFLVFLSLGLHLAKRLIFDSFAYSLCIGLVLLICMPAFINVGVVTGMLPTKGLVLPLVGYGGTCVLVSLTAIGILLSLIKYSRKHERHIESLKKIS